MKRKIRWKALGCDAIGHDQQPHTFQWVSRSCYSSQKGSWTDWHLAWDGCPLEKFQSERDLKLYIIRFIYSMDERYAIPSLLLYEAGLRYRHAIWVDEWYAPNSGHAHEDNIVTAGTSGDTMLWLPRSRKLNFEHERPRKGHNGASSGSGRNFLRLQKGKKQKKGKLVPVRAPEVDIREEFDEIEARFEIETGPKLPTYDRVLRRPIPAPGFVAVKPDWEDFSWESRPQRPLSHPPKKMPSDASCVTVLNAEIGFPAPEKSKKEKKA